MRLRNSVKTRIGPNTYQGRCFMHPVQMLIAGAWQDIKPRLVRDPDGWHVESAPYYAEVKDNGTRLICPDALDRSKYIRLPSIPLLSLAKNVASTPAQLDKQVLPNQIVMPTAWGSIRIIFKNNRIAFHIQVDKTTPVKTLAIPIDSIGFDIATLLTAKSGLIIPRPKVIDTQGKEIALSWTYKNGELSLDLPDIEPPFTFKNASLAVAASADDCQVLWNGSAWAIGALTLTYCTVGYYGATALKSGGGLRFQNINIPAGATWLTAGLTLVAYASNANTACNAAVCGELDANAAIFSTLADYQARRGTDAGGADNTHRTTARQAENNISAWTAGSTYALPSDFASVGQEMTNTLGALTTIVLFIDDHDGRSDAATQRSRAFASWDHALYAAPVFDYTFTSTSYGIDAFIEAEKVYYEAKDGVTLDGRTDITAQSAEERATTLTAFKAAFPGDTYYEHTHHHNNPLAACTLGEV